MVIAGTENKLPHTDESPHTPLYERGVNVNGERRSEEIVLDARNDSSDYPRLNPPSPPFSKGGEFGEKGREMEVPSSSSLSVTIENEKGNIIVVSRVEETESTSTSTSDLMITDESDRLVLTWQGKGRVKGFILHRAEKGKDNYTPITSLIPYFGQGGRERFLYKFIDNATKPSIQYDYRLEVVEKIREDNLTMGKLAE